MKIIKKKLRYDKDFLENFFINKYNLTSLEKNYFDYIDYENILIFNEKELNSIEKLVQSVNIIFKKAYKIYINSFEKNNNYFAIYKNNFKKTYKNIKHFIARYDLLIDQNWVLKFIEINANTPWLITDIYHIQTQNKFKKYKNISKNFKKYVKEFFKKYKDKKIWILLAYNYEDEDFLVWLDYMDILKEIIHEENIIIWDIYETNIIADTYFSIKWEKIDILLNFFPIEFFLSDKQYFESFLQILNKKTLEIFNPLESIILQDKLLFAVIWENINKFSQKEQVIIRKHIVFTSRVFDENMNYIAKNRYERLGRGVYENNYFSNIKNTKDFIFQEKILSKSFLKEKEIIVLWIYTNMQKSLSLIWRKQKDLITKEGNNKVILTYKY